MRDEPHPARRRAREFVEYEREVLGAADALGRLGAVEVGAERDVLGPEPCRDVVDVAGDVGPLRADVLVVEADADHAAGVAHRVELAVGEVARVGHQRVRRTRG